MKKIIGIFSIILAITSIINVINKPSVGVIVLIPLYIFTGVFLVIFDNVYKKSYIDGFYARNVQNIILAVLTIVWVVLWVFILLGWVALSFSGAFCL